MKQILDYLAALEQNNDREWFHAHKEEYHAAARQFEELVGVLLLRLRELDGSIPPAKPGELCFKLMRDTRFSHDKSPYNPAFRAHIGPKGKLPIPVGYFLFLRPGDRSFLGGGLFADCFKDATAMIRERIAAQGGEWGRLLGDPAFASRFTLQGARLKRVPQGYESDHPQAEYLKYKSWYLEVPVTDRQLLGEGFLDEAVETFAAMRPFNGFLNEALTDFVMPQRPGK